MRSEWRRTRRREAVMGAAVTAAVFLAAIGALGVIGDWQNGERAGWVALVAVTVLGGLGWFLRDSSG